MGFEMKPLIDIEEAAEYLGLHTATLYLMVRQKRVPAKKIGRRWRFRVDELEQFASGVVVSGDPNRGAKDELQTGNARTA